MTTQFSKIELRRHVFFGSRLTIVGGRVDFYGSGTPISPTSANYVLLGNGVCFIADVMQQIHPQLGGQAFADYMNYPEGYPNGIPREFYEALAWEGLKETGTKGWSGLTENEKSNINAHLAKALYGRKSCN